MSVLLEASNNGPIGVQPRSVIVRCIAGASIAQYDLVVLDFSKASELPGTGTSTYPTASNSKFANVVKGPTGKGALTTGLYGVAQEAIASGAEGRIMFAGITPVNAASASYQAGNVVGIPASGLTAGTVTNATVTQAVGTVVLPTASTSTTLPTIILDGSISFGS